MPDRRLRTFKFTYFFNQIRDLDLCLLWTAPTTIHNCSIWSVQPSSALQTLQIALLFDWSPVVMVASSKVSSAAWHTYDRPYQDENATWGWSESIISQLAIRNNMGSVLVDTLGTMKWAGKPTSQKLDRVKLNIPSDLWDLYNLKHCCVDEASGLYWPHGISWWALLLVCNFCWPGPPTWKFWKILLGQQVELHDDNFDGPVFLKDVLQAKDRTIFSHWSS